MQAGRYYMLDAFAKEQHGGDNLAVGVTLPDNTPLADGTRCTGEQCKLWPIPVQDYLFVDAALRRPPRGGDDSDGSVAPAPSGAEYQSCLEQDQPPPNKYDLGLDRPLAFRWGGKGTVFGSEEQRPINGGPLGGNRTGPGPARYHVNTRAGTPHPDGRSRTPQAYTINGKWSFTGSLESKSNRVPGPGHYNLHPTLGAQVLSRSKSATSFSFGTSPSRIAVTPGYRPHGTGMLLPARFKTDTTPGAIY